MQDVFIVAARRTPIGRFNGTLAGATAVELGATALGAVLADAPLDAGEIAEVTMGNVLTAGLGQNPARQAAVAAGVPYGVPATTINCVCGSGLKAVALGAQALAGGAGRLWLAGGQESMSRAPHVLGGLRQGVKMGDISARDTMIVDGLWDAFNDVHMGLTAENLARLDGITRARQDEYSLGSQRKAAEALAAGRFEAEIAPVVVTERRQVRTITRDEQPNLETTAEKLAALRPSFDPAGCVTAGNASSLNDGAAAVLLAAGPALDPLGLLPRARIVSSALAGVDPMLMGLGPVEAARRALDQAGWQAHELDLVEVNEAFAAVALAIDARMDWDAEKVNVNGGAIALGHPIGASGARLLVSLLHEMERRDVRRGLATLCIGGGMGIAMCIERERR